MCSISVWLYWGYIQMLLPAESEENYKSFQATFHDSLSASLLMFFHFCCAGDAAVIPHSVHLYRGTSTLLLLSLWKGIAAFSPVWEHFSEPPPCAGPGCPWDNLPERGLLLWSIRLFFNISLPWFQGKQEMGEGKPVYHLKVVSSCSLSHIHVLPCICPSQCSAWSSSGLYCMFR